MINIEQTDSIDGDNPSRQATILIVHILCILGISLTTTFFQVLLLLIAGFEEFAKEYLKNGSFLPLTLLLSIPPIWWYLKNGYLNPGANRIQATDNQFSPSQFVDGGTQFIVYQAGFALRYPWERLQGREVTVENQEALGTKTVTITIKKAAIEVRVKGLWRVYLPRLSFFIQNIENREIVLEQLKSLINQTLEEFCANQCKDTNDARKRQTEIAKHIFDVVYPVYLEYGIELVALNFSKFDYSEDTQKELNKILELEATREVAERIKNPEKFRLAAAASGKAGVKVSKDIREIKMTPKTAEALSKMGLGGAVALGLHEGGNKQ